MPADDSAFCEGRGCYTSARLEAGRVRHEAQHLERLDRGAAALELGRFDADEARRAFAALGETFANGRGVVRLQLSEGTHGHARLVGIPREIGHEPAIWSAVTATVQHPGAWLAGGHKLTYRLPQALAHQEAQAAGCDEALMLDGAGRLVEGTRSNLVIVTAAGTLATPPDARGAVAGIALGLLRDALPELESCDITRDGIRSAQLVLCVNAVRGARAVTTLDGESVGSASHSVLDRCRRVLDGDTEGAV